MHASESQRVQTAIARAAKAVEPTVQRELEQAYGPDWLKRVNDERVARGQSPARGVHDHRFVLALVGHEPALAHVFDEDQRRAGKRLNGMGNALAHNEPLRDGDGERAEELAQRLVTRAVDVVGRGSAPTSGVEAPGQLVPPSAPASRVETKRPPARGPQPPYGQPPPARAPQPPYGQPPPAKGALSVVIAVFVAALVYILLVALTGSSILALVAGVIVLVAGIPTGGYGTGRRF